jgi:hypothetical protein
VAKHCSTLKGIALTGLHAYDGHIRDVDFEMKKKNVTKLLLWLRKLNEKLRLPTIVMGGLASFSVHCKRKHMNAVPVHLCIGIKVILIFVRAKIFTAIVLVTRIISLPSANRICTDLGHKSVAAENEITRRVFFLNAEGLKPVGQSEEHLYWKQTKIILIKWEISFTVYHIMFAQLLLYMKESLQLMIIK